MLLKEKKPTTEKQLAAMAYARAKLKEKREDTKYKKALAVYRRKKTYDDNYFERARARWKIEDEAKAKRIEEVAEAKRIRDEVHEKARIIEKRVRIEESKRNFPHLWYFYKDHEKYIEEEAEPVG